MRKIYIIPNLVTTANLFSGFYSIILSTQSEFRMAAFFIIIASIFDGLDGRIARLARATSQFGVEYDSLSDLVSFGLAPSLLLYFWALQDFGRFGIIAAFLYVCCGALRLARFNLNTSVVSKAYFQGVPSPVAAGTIASFILFKLVIGYPSLDSNPSQGFFALGFSLSLAALMVSTIPFPSFKEFHWRSRSSFSLLLAGVLAMGLVILNPEVNLFLMIAGYISFSLLWNIYRIIIRKPIELKLNPSSNPLSK